MPISTWLIVIIVYLILRLKFGENSQARCIAESGVSYAISRLNQDTTWTGIQGLAMSDGTLTVTCTVTYSEFPSGPNMGLESRREIMSVGKVNEQEDTVYAVLQISKLSALPPFMEYALASENDIEIQGAFSIEDDGNPEWNSNVHTNGDLVVQGSGYNVEGFGSYVGTMRRPSWQWRCS